MRLFTAQVANYFGKGNTRTYYQDGGWSLNVLCLKLGKYQIRVVQDRSVISNKIKPEGSIHTTDIEVAGVEKFEDGVRVVNDLCRLLSFASFSQVTPFQYSFPGRRIRFNISAQAMCFRPLIEIMDGNETQAYLEKTWMSYRKNKRSRKLAEVIDMLTITELPVQPLEVRLAQIFIIMENLKSTFARKSRIPFYKGFFRDCRCPNKPLHKQQTIGFEMLLTLMFKDVGMKPSLRRVIKLRNEIIHFGLSRKPYRSLIKDYEYCHDIVREYLLRLLRYEGDYLLYSKASRSICTL